MSFAARATLSTTSEHPALVSAARSGLVQTRSVRLDQPEAVAVLERARFDHLTGMLAAAVFDGTVVIGDASVRERLERQWHDELRLCIALESFAVRTARMLDAAGISWRLTKGPAVAHLDYGDPSLRTFGDVDVVIHPGDWADAQQLLAGYGFERHAPTLPGSYDSRFGKGVTLTADGLELDVHRRFAVGRFGVTTRMEDLFATAADEIELAGHALPAFPPAHRLLHACYHASLGGFRRLRALRDVAQLLLVTGAEWELTFDIARTWKGEAVVASAIVECWKQLELDIDHPAHERAMTTTISNADDRALRLFASGAPFRRQALSAVSRLPLHQVPTYLWILAPHRRGRRL